MNSIKIITIGVYGYSETHFFESLVKANVDLFCDVRLRRGMRGSKYAFVNSRYLQGKLSQLDIKYIHLKHLAPNQELRNKQKLLDNEIGDTKRSRKFLSHFFIDTYQKENLWNFNSNEFISTTCAGAKCIVLFCVEQLPDACHRSIVARQLERDLQINVEHLLP